MSKRYVTLWFPYLLTDWFALRRPGLKILPFVLAAPDHGRMRITASNSLAMAQGVDTGMAVADARVFIPSLEVLDDKPGLTDKLLLRIAEWCIRYTPAVSIDPPNGIILDATGCAHLWGGEKKYLEEMISRFKKLSYTVRAGMADTIGAAWGITRFAEQSLIIESDGQSTALLPLPPAALRLEPEIVERLYKLGIRQISNFIGMPRPALRRRFGQSFILRLDQAMGLEEEVMTPVQPVELYQERLPCLEPIVTRTGIEIALQRLLETIGHSLEQEQKGLRIAVFKGYRLDNKIVSIQIGTHRPTHNTVHLFKLFEFKIASIEPGPGIELFMLEAQKVESVIPEPMALWKRTAGLLDNNLSELLDRVSGKLNGDHIHRYVPDEHYWPERSIKAAASLDEELQSTWKTERRRPVQLLTRPEKIDVTAPIPDYPPMLFRYKGKLHKIIKADGPERIEQEWWLQQGQHRDYYCVEDEEGKRYWLFRSGHYADRNYEWYLHGFFA